MIKQMVYCSKVVAVREEWKARVWGWWANAEFLSLNPLSFPAPRIPRGTLSLMVARIRSFGNFPHGSRKVSHQKMDIRHENLT